MADPVDPGDRLAARVQEVGLHRGERFEAEVNFERFQVRAGLVRGSGRVAERLLGRDARQEAALLRRPQDHHAAAKLARRLGQSKEIIARPRLTAGSGDVR